MIRNTRINEKNFINCNTAMINTRQQEAVIVNALLEYGMSPLSK